MRRTRIASVLVGLLLPAMVALPAGAQAGSLAACTFTFDVHFSHPISLTTSSGPYSSGGENGIADCTGVLNGHRVTGLGTFGFQGQETANCFLDEAAGTYFFTVPTEAGRMHFTGTFIDTRLGTALLLDASGQGLRFTGTVLVIPQQNCVLTPMTEAKAISSGVFTTK